MRPGELRLRVLGEVLRGNTRTVEIRDALGVRDHRTVNVTLGRLADEGLVEKTGRALWALTDAGRAFIEQVRLWINEEAR